MRGGWSSRAVRRRRRRWWRQQWRRRARRLTRDGGDVHHRRLALGGVVGLPAHFGCAYHADALHGVTPRAPRRPLGEQRDIAGLCHAAGARSIAAAAPQHNWAPALAAPARLWHLPGAVYGMDERSAQRQGSRRAHEALLLPASRRRLGAAWRSLMHLLTLTTSTSALSTSGPALHRLHSTRARQRLRSAAARRAALQAPPPGARRCRCTAAGLA